MKRYIRAWYTGEPSMAEYGKFMSDRHKHMQEMYAPFAVEDISFNPCSVNSTGYRITLEDAFNSSEWIADMKGNSFADKSYDLYGPFYPGEINSWGDLSRHKPIANGFNSLGSVMNYLFTELDIET